jgi:hypothetical protein
MAMGKVFFHGVDPSQIVTRCMDDGLVQKWVALSGARYNHAPGSRDQIAYGPTEIDAVYNLGYQIRSLEVEK